MALYSTVYVENPFQGATRGESWETDMAANQVQMC